MTNKFFWQGVRTDEDALIMAMDVVGDRLVAEYGSRIAKQRASHELTILKDLEAVPAEARDRCAALWTLMTTGDDTAATKLIAAAKETRADAAKATVEVRYMHGDSRDRLKRGLSPP